MTNPRAWLIVVLIVVGIAGGAHGGTPVPGLVETTVVDGLTAPTAMAFLPDGRLLVTQQGGALVLVDGGTKTLLATLPVCFPLFDPSFATETGLLGIAVHPTFPADRSIYLYRTRNTLQDDCTEFDLFDGAARNEVVRVTLGTDDTVDLGSLQTILPNIRAESGFHNGGCLRVGPDDKLYVSIGDNAVGTGGPAPGTVMSPYPQDLTTLEGKILRLELTGGAPSDNPFVAMGGGVRPEIFAYGFRNPWRFGFDPVTQALWAGDVGEETIEEIDRVVAGGNYGWSHCEGTLPVGCELSGDVPPVFSYPHAGAGALGESVTGGAFTEGGVFAAHPNEYVFGDFGEEPNFGALYAVTVDAGRTGFEADPGAIVTGAGGPVDIVAGPDGAIYYVAYVDGAIRRLAPEGVPPGGCDTIPTCQVVVDATLPDPAMAADKKSRKAAKKVARFDRKSDKKLAKAVTKTGTKQARLYKQARKSLEKLLAAARAANASGRLGVPLAPIEAAVAALLALVPSA